MPEGEPRPANAFRLKLDGKESAKAFRELSGLGSETEVIEQKYTDANGQPMVRKVSGAAKWTDVTLKRVADENLELWKWRDVVLKEGPDKARVDAVIELLDYGGQAIATYQLKQCWPKSYKGVTLNAGGNDAGVEEIVLVHEGFERA